MKTILLKNIVTLLITLVITSASFAYAQLPATQVSSTISTSSEVQKNNIAPGTALPVYVQLLNFGSPGEQVDTILHYGIYNQKGELVLERSETVAVQTTASFTRYINLPESFLPGVYTLSLKVEYENQQFPAISEQQFVVEKKILGYSLSEWYAALPFAAIPIALVAFLYKRRHGQVLHYEKSYEHVEAEERFYYEIIHDIIKSLHYHVGQKKMKKILELIPEIEMDRTGQYIYNLNGEPEMVIASLMKHYEKATGMKANFVIGRETTANRIV